MEPEERLRFLAHLHLMQAVAVVDQQAKQQGQVEDQVVVAAAQKMQVSQEQMER